MLCASTLMNRLAGMGGGGCYFGDGDGDGADEEALCDYDAQEFGGAVGSESVGCKVCQAEEVFELRVGVFGCQK